VRECRLAGGQVDKLACSSSVSLPASQVDASARVANMWNGVDRTPSCRYRTRNRPEGSLSMWLKSRRAIVEHPGGVAHPEPRDSQVFVRWPTLGPRRSSVASKSHLRSANYYS
jgi:hypothetical protein